MDNELKVMAINALRPGIKWGMQGGEVLWTDNTQPRPTDAEIQEWIENTAYQRTREYNSFGEQLDCLFHDIDSGLFGEDAKTGMFYLGIKAVKDNDPKL